MAAKGAGAAPRRRLTTVSAAVIGVLALVLTIFAVLDKGYAGTEIRGNNGGVFVLNKEKSLLGRINVDAHEFDARIATDSADDVLQSGSVVFLRTPDGLQRVNVFSQRLEGSVPLGAGTAVHLGGDRALVEDPEGRVWVLTPDQLAAFDATETKPTLELDGGPSQAAAGVVTTSGNAYVLDGDTLRSLPRSEATPVISPGKPIEIEHESTDGDAVVLTAVGETPVVFDPATGTLVVGEDADVISLEKAGIPDASSAVVQQPSSESDHVLVATADSLYAVPLDGGTAERLKVAGSGTPVTPVQAAGCDYGAWEGSLQFLTRCGGSEPDTGAIEGAAAGADLELRTNRELVVLNDVQTGTSWMIADNMQIVNSWELTQPIDFQKTIEQKQETLTSTVMNIPPDQRDENRPPVANPDAFGVRPGSSTVLPVVGNDTDPDGDVLIATVDQQPGIGTITPIRGGTELQIDVAPDATGTAEFAYTVDDGRGGSAAGTVTLEVHPPGQNEGPRPADNPPQLKISRGATISFNVLPHFRDPDGDDFYLARAEVDGADDGVTFRPDGMVTFTDSGLVTGMKSVKLTFRDAEGGSSDGELLIDVVEDRDLPPISTQDHITLVAGSTGTVSPLANDMSPAGGELSLMHVADTDRLALDPDLAAGTIDISGAEPDTYYVGYQTGSGAQSVQGLVRVDIVPPTTEALAPVTVSDLAMVTSGSSVLVDPLENDVDPTGGVLVLDQVTPPQQPGVTVEVVDHHLLRISTASDAPRSDVPLSITYRAANGTGTKEGVVRLMVVAPDAQMPYPIAVRDSALVRTGDVVRIPVLDNDRSPSGSPLRLVGIVDGAASQPAGTFEITEDELRFVAAPDAPAGTIRVSYGIEDETGRAATAPVEIKVIPADDPNDAPKPDNSTARVLAGTTVRIPVRTSGIDPDGDSTLLTSITAPAPTQGRVIAASGEWIEYEADNDARGADRITYEVMDPSGATGTGEIELGIAPRPTTNLPPVTVQDEMHVRPGRKLQHPVLANDTDPEGQVLAIDDSLTAADDPKALVIDEPDGAVRIPSISMTAPSEPGAYAYTYGASDGQLSSPGRATILVDEDAPQLAPIARDDYVDPASITGAEDEAVTVDVLANDQDPDGSVEGFVPTLDDPASTATVSEDGTLSIPVTGSQQRIRYTIRDMDGQTASAYVWVPGSDAQAPRWIGPTLEATAGSPLTIDLRDEKNVRVRAASAGVTILDAQTATANHSDGGTLVASPTTVAYTAEEGYSGPDQISIDVTDGTDAAAPEGVHGTLIIPVQVTSSTNHAPTLQGFPLEVEAGAAPRPVELSASAEDVDGDPLAFDIGQHSAPSTVSVSVSPPGRLVVEATAETPKGTAFEIPVTADDGQNPPASATVAVSVVGSRQAMITTGVDDVVVDAGTPQTVEALKNDSNPFPGEPRYITGAEVVTGGDGVTAQPQGETVVLSATRGWHGTATVTYRVQDKTRDPDREQTGTIRAAVRAEPAPPSAPRIDSVGDGTVTLSFTPGADNGAPIDGYTVTAASGGGSVTSCPTTTCTVTGLANGTTYTFTVTAHNAVGDSQPSSASAEATPDVKPDPPQAPTVTRGDTSLQVAWREPGNRGTPITGYELQIQNQATGALDTMTLGGGERSATWSDLVNGTDYSFRIRASNSSPDPSEWSGWSAPEHPAGKPQRPAGTPRATRINDPLGGGVTVTFSPLSKAEANGEPITQYVVTASSGQSVPVGPGESSATFRDLDRNRAVSFTYTAVNSVGTSDPSAASEPLVPFAVPKAPDGVTASTPEPHGRATVSWSPAESNGTDLKQYVIRWQGGSVTVPATETSRTITGLTNGTSYKFTVQADNGYAGGQSPLSKPSEPSVTPYTNPGKPTVSASAGACNGNSCPVTFTVHSAGDGGGGGIARVEWARNGDWSKIQTVTGDGATFTIPRIDAAPGEAVKIEVRTVNARGLPSANVPATQKANVPVADPKLVIFFYGNADFEAGCERGNCQYVDARVSNLQPDTTYSYCLGGTAAGASPCWYPLDPNGNAVRGSFTTDGNGAWSTRANGIQPFWGHSGDSIWIEVDGQRSNSVRYQ
ncbi:Ig-like domain-containing protein [Brachybacterium huguangmaarense]